ncbi:MAG: iron-sulfur cluster carrier protein ApbC [Methylococcaceae bacterium]|nr:iron-sulfur cluster carrier protein ApbC [Methylococcaceae bacterium]
MSSDLKSAINTALQTIMDPYLETDLVSAKTIKHLEIKETTVLLKITLGYPAKSYESELKKIIRHTLKALAGITAIDITVDYEIASHAVQKSLKLQPNIKNIIAVASGKGGVGKSTTSVNLALALSAEGANVGILDADIYGPSIPTMLGLSGHPTSHDGKTMEPKVAFSIQTSSIGYLIDPDQPMIWRGPMVTNALQQLLKDTNWNDLDYLLIDLPPGTGDIQLTLAQQIPVTAAIIVTTPQDIALLDAQRGLGMFNKVNIPVLGIVENMSIHICSECGHEEAIFGSGGGSTMAEKNAVPLLGALPLDINIRQLADTGTPTVAHDPDGKAATMYREIARKMTAKLSLQNKDHSGKFGNIVIQ